MVHCCSKTEFNASETSAGHIIEARRSDWSRVAGDEEAGIVPTFVGNALLMIRETTYDAQNVAIEYCLSPLRGDRYTASVISVRKN